LGVYGHEDAGEIIMSIGGELMGWSESVGFSCEECGEDVQGRAKSDVYCPHCGHVNMYEPTDIDYENVRTNW
jgi:predicted RNA-binding Zn-ribbon protein involved in translation (DUF1610 family)